MRNARRRGLTIAAGALAGLILAVLADFAISPIVLPEPNAGVEWVGAAERPYLLRDDGWYELKRDFSGRDYWGTAIYAVKTDEYGYRTNERGPAKSGLADTIVLGDSFAYGINGPWADTFAGMYDLASARRILNAAVPSYSPTPYLHRYREALDRGALTPAHTVIVALDISDVHDEAGVWIDGADHPKSLRAVNDDMGLVGEVRAAAAAGWRGRLRDRLRFTGEIYRYFRYSVFRIPNDGVFDQMVSAFTWDDWARLDATPAAITGFSPLGVAGGLDRITRKVADIVTAARAVDSRVYVLIYPWPAQLKHPSTFSWPGFVAEVCERAQCAGVIDTFPAFEAQAKADAGWYDDLYVSNDVHFNRRGNRLIHEELARVLPP